MKKIVSIVLILIVGVTFFIQANMQEEKKEFFLQDIKEHLDENAPFDLTEHVGKNLIVSFWTTWCPYCVQEIPDFIKFKEEYKDQVEILMVHVPADETFKTAQEFFEKNEYGKNLKLLEDNGFYAHSFGVKGFPTNIIFNKEGKMISYGYGTDYNALKDIFEKNNMFASEEEGKKETDKASEENNSTESKENKDKK